MKYIIIFVLGVLFGWFLGCNHNPTQETIEKIKTEIVYDTVQVKVQLPTKTKYITRVETDSILLERHDTIWQNLVVYLPDSVKIPINTYIDTIHRKDYELVYNIQTLGSLLDFDYNLSFYPQVYIKKEYINKKWLGSVGISDKLNYKLGVGYKGWVVESEFNKRLNFNEIYLTKQFYLK